MMDYCTGCGRCTSSSPCGICRQQRDLVTREPRLIASDEPDEDGLYFVREYAAHPGGWLKISAEGFLRGALQ